MNKLFDAQSWRNRLTALGVILDLKPLPEDEDTGDISESECPFCNPHSCEEIPLTDAERAVNKVLAEHRLQESVKLFRDSMEDLCPEFAYLLKRDGDPNHVPHDCVENLNCELFCNICGASYDTAREHHQGIHLLAKGEQS